MNYRLLISLLFIPLVTYGQIAFRNQSLINPDTNVIYVGIDNHIKISGLKNYSGLKLSVPGYSTPVDSEGNVTVRTGFVGRKMITLYQGSRILASKEYSFDTIRRPKVRIGPYLNANVSYNQIKYNNIVSAYYPGCVARLKIDVLSFYLDLLTANNETLESHAVIGNKIPDSILDLIRDLKEGSKLYFYNFHVKGADDWGPYPPFYIYIK